MQKGKIRVKIFLVGILIFISGLISSSCSTSGKAGKRKNCDCPRWSQIEIQKQPGVVANEKI